MARILAEETYTIQKNDSLAEIARKRYGFQKYWKAILGANKKRFGTTPPKNLYIGEICTLPRMSIENNERDETSPYAAKVRATQALWEIYPEKISTSEINQERARRTTATNHTVIKGEMLSTIAKKYVGSARYWPLIQKHDRNKKYFEGRRARDYRDNQSDDEIIPKEVLYIPSVFVLPTRMQEPVVYQKKAVAFEEKIEWYEYVLREYDNIGDIITRNIGFFTKEILSLFLEKNPKNGSLSTMGVGVNKKVTIPKPMSDKDKKRGKDVQKNAPTEKTETVKKTADTDDTKLIKAIKTKYGKDVVFPFWTAKDGVVLKDKHKIVAYKVARRYLELALDAAETPKEVGDMKKQLSVVVTSALRTTNKQANSMIHNATEKHSNNYVAYVIKEYGATNEKKLAKHYWESYKDITKEKATTKNDTAKNDTAKKKLLTDHKAECTKKLIDFIKKNSTSKHLNDNDSSIWAIDFRIPEGISTTLLIEALKDLNYKKGTNYQNEKDHIHLQSS